MTPDASATPPLPSRLAWAMLLALTAAFCMSQAFRSIGALLAPPLQQSLGLDARQLGTFTAGFHFAFGLSQLLFMYVVLKAYSGRGEPAAAKPWEGAEGLEWTVPSPAPFHTFEEPPVVK